LSVCRCRLTKHSIPTSSIHLNQAKALPYLN
jgi:hypothetical protein